jgi:hypothetical protein
LTAGALFLQHPHQPLPRASGSTFRVWAASTSRLAAAMQAAPWRLGRKAPTHWPGCRPAALGCLYVGFVRGWLMPATVGTDVHSH